MSKKETLRIIDQSDIPKTAKIKKIDLVILKQDLSKVGLASEVAVRLLLGPLYIIDDDCVKERFNVSEKQSEMIKKSKKVGNVIFGVAVLVGIYSLLIKE